MSIDIKTPVADFLFLLIFVLFCCLAHCCYAIDRICQGQPIRDDGGQTLVSEWKTFELGFFSPAGSSSRYVGIWYYNMEEKAVVWVANRDSPISDRNGVLKIRNDGNLVVLDGNNRLVWATNSSLPSNNTVAVLQDTGNFVLSSNFLSFEQCLFVDESNVPYYFQSFDYPSDTYLPGMTIAASNFSALRSWKSANDPSTGDFTMGIDLSEAPQIVIRNQTARVWRSGYWNGSTFVGVPNITNSILDGFFFNSRGKSGSISLDYSPPSSTILLRFRIGWDGNGERLAWDDNLKKWNMVPSLEPANECELYNFCGNSGVCNVFKSPKCSCLPGFEPTNKEEWNRGIWKNGCTRRTKLQCSRANSSNEVGKEGGFLKLNMMKLPDFYVEHSSNSKDECKPRCLSLCFCIAYAYAEGIGCMSWWNDSLTDIRELSSGGEDLYIRLVYSEFDRKEKVKLIIIITAASIIGAICIFCTYFIKRQLAKGRGTRNENREEIRLFDRGETSTSEVELQEVPLFKFEELAIATNNFNIANLLGKGGFGPVFRGALQNGQEIAVKRLSKTSRQGLKEFINEVLLISNLQHRNLVKLLGGCVEGEERILIYEYMPNNSLDTYLFDPVKKELLEWRKRFNIIKGISRGLLYLHQDSRMRIIHRDLKVSNILLDEKLLPKISDFGLARFFGGNEDQANTKRVVGTYGYMSPEYTMKGFFSEKSDVYSFGVLLLEIVSGRRNTSFYHDEHLSLVGYAWKLWIEGNILALVDNMVSDPCHHLEVLRCIHVGLLCVQEFAKDRPNMSTVILMLSSEITTVNIPSPKKPAFILRKNTTSSAESPAQPNQQSCSVNTVTLSTVEGR